MLLWGIELLDSWQSGASGNWYFTLIQGEDSEVSVSKQVNIWLTKEDKIKFLPYKDQRLRSQRNHKLETQKDTELTIIVPPDPSNP